MFIVSASPPERTPPLISSVLQNSNVLFSVPFAKLLLGDRKRYLDREPLFAAGLIVLSVLPSLHTHTHSLTYSNQKLNEFLMPYLKARVFLFYTIARPNGF